MKKRYVKYILAAILTLATVVTLLACSSSEKKGECDHEFNKWNVIKEATCSKEGAKARRCTLCGEREREVIEKGEHKAVTAKGFPSTCTQRGLSDSQICSICRIVLTEAKPLPFADHEPVYKEGVPATCQSPGYTGHSSCKNCRIIISTSEEIPQLPHTESVIPGDNINCMQIGTTEGRFCTTCGVSTVDQRIGYGNHTYQNGACIHCDETENVSKGLKMELDPSGNGYIVVDEGTCTDKDIVIPRLYNGLPVVKIRNSAFMSKILITSVVIPSSVTEIGDEAFIRCKNLKSLTFNGSVERIGASAFSGCTSLEEVVLPESLTYIGQKAFYNCTSLKSIVIGSNLVSNDLIIPSSMLAKCSALKSVVIKTNVSAISSNTFEDCFALYSITFDGTKEEWGKIDLANHWYFYSRLATVSCKDGYITL